MSDDFQDAIETGLVATGWLAERLGRPDLRVLDATYFMPAAGRSGRAEFAERHIPGAVFFDIDDIAAPPSDLPHMLPDAATFAAKAGALGIGNRHRLVVYDTHGLMSAARAWWMFRAFGHDAVAVLDGGLPKWLAEGYPVESGVAAPAPEHFEARLQPALVRDKDLLLANLAAPRETVVDARAAGRFEGTAPEPWPGRRSGHIPGSRNVDHTTLIDPTSKTLLPPDALAARFAAAGVPEDAPLVTSCGSGVSAGVLALALHRLGRRDVALYDGSWAEWGLRDGLPIETGPAR